MLPRPVTIGIETTGYTQWFHTLMHRLGHTVLVGEAAKIRAMVVRKTKTDRRDARHLPPIRWGDTSIPGATGRQMAGEASEAMARRTRTPPDSLGGHVDPWGPYAPRGCSATRRPRSSLWPSARAARSGIPTT